MGQLLSNLANGSLVKLAENSKPTKFIKLDNDHYGTGTGVTLIRKDTFNERQWEASYDSSYKNRYIGCLLDNFCDGIWPLKLDEKIRECLVPVPIVVAEGNQVATLHTIYRRGFALRGQHVRRRHFVASHRTHARNNLHFRGCPRTSPRRNPRWRK